MPCKYAAAIAVMQSGVHDLSVVASAVGLDIDQIKEIDAATDPPVRLLAVQGIPAGQSFKLCGKLLCPKCKGWITIIPCIWCAQLDQAC